MEQGKVYGVYAVCELHSFSASRMRERGDRENNNGAEVCRSAHCKSAITARALNARRPERTLHAETAELNTAELNGTEHTNCAPLAHFWLVRGHAPAA